MNQRIFTKRCLFFAHSLFVATIVSQIRIVSASKVKITSDGGYTGIVIKVDNAVSEEMCPQILENTKKLLDESSFSLYEALDRKAYFNSVSLVVPSHWRDSKCQTVISATKNSQPYRQPNIIIGASHPVYGNKPHTQQSRGCGQPGDVISVPYQFLLKWNNTWNEWGDPAKLFTHEWAKYRYGVFDEMGYAGDLMYPNYFISKGEILPTGTSDAKVHGAWVDANGKSGCSPVSSTSCNFMPYTKNRQVKCSLGFLNYLPSTTTYCDKSSAQPVMSPTKHNVLCGGKQAMDIIMNHADFHQQYQTETSKKVTKVNLHPTIHVMRNPKPKYVLIMETSTELDSHGQWKWINKAAQKFIRYDLPLQSNVAIVTFSNDSKIQHPMVQISDNGIRSRVADTIPDKYHLTKSNSQCLLCGVQKAIHEVLRKDMAGAHLILVTRGVGEGLSISDEQTIEEYVKHYFIKVSSVIVPQDENKMPLAFYDSIAQMSGGTSHIIRSAKDRNLNTYMDLVKGFANLLEDNTPQTVYRNVIEMTGYSSSSGTFTVDPNLGRDTRFGIFVEDEEDHLIKSISFSDSRGLLYGPFTSMSSLYDIINLKVINYPVAGSPPFDQNDLVGLPWQYTIEWYPGGLQRQKSAIVVTSHPRSELTDFEIDIWTNSDLSSDIVTSQHPLSIFAKITKGKSPVVEARVEVEVSVASTNGTVDVYTMRLSDSGNGDPDLQSGDGIYSRYITHYPSQGRYSFVVHVNDNNRRAYSMVPEDVTEVYDESRAKRAMPLIRASNGEELMSISTTRRCCGSKIVVPESKRLVTGEFSRLKKGPVIHLLSVPGMGVDLMPPSRITDLKLEQLEQKKNMFMATWTAPGDDFDYGSVSGYKFVYAKNMTSLLDPNEKNYKTLTKFERPDEAGIQTSYQVSFDEFNAEFYMGLLAFDERRNEGKISNIVRIYVDSNELAITSPEPQQTPVSATEQGQDDGVMIGILCGTFLVIGLMLWLGIWFIRTHKSTKNGGVNATLVSGVNGDLHDTSSSDLEIKTPPRRHLMVPQFSSLASGGPVGTFPRTRNSDKEDANTPTYWSASQLLEEHEQRTSGDSNLYSTTTYHNNHPAPLDPIVEDPEDTYGISEMYNLAYNNNNRPIHGTLTSTPIKYANLTFPRRGQSVSPSHVSDSILANSSRIGPPREEVVYGYAQSEPPNGLYGTLQRRNSKGKIPPQIPPKPSLSALLGLNQNSSANDQSLSDDVLLKRNDDEKDSNALSVRNISHV